MQADPPEDKSSETTFSWDKTERPDVNDFIYQNLKDQSKVKPPGSGQNLQDSWRHAFTGAIPFDLPGATCRSIQGQQFVIENCQVSYTEVLLDVLVCTCVTAVRTWLTYALLTVGLQHLSV